MTRPLCLSAAGCLSKADALAKALELITTATLNTEGLGRALVVVVMALVVWEFTAVTMPMPMLGEEGTSLAALVVS